MTNFVTYLVALLPVPFPPTVLDLELQACYPPREVAMQRWREACEYRDWLNQVKNAGVAGPGWQEEYDQTIDLVRFHDLLTNAMWVEYNYEHRVAQLVAAKAVAVEMGYPANTWLSAMPFR